MSTEARPVAPSCSSTKQPLHVADVLPLCVHPHVQGPIFAEGEASLCLIHLHGGTASVQQDRINAAWLHLQATRRSFKLTKAAQQWFHAASGEEIKNFILLNNSLILSPRN